MICILSVLIFKSAVTMIFMWCPLANSFSAFNRHIHKWIILLIWIYLRIGLFHNLSMIYLRYPWRLGLLSPGLWAFPCRPSNWVLHLCAGCPCCLHNWHLSVLVEIGHSNYNLSSCVPESYNYSMLIEHFVEERRNKMVDLKNLIVQIVLK